MWLGWDHCGYNSIDDEPLDLDNTMEWQPTPSGGRGERAHLLSPVSLPRDVRDRNRRDEERRQQQQRQQRPQHRNASVNRTGDPGAGYLDEESEGGKRRLSAESMYAGSGADAASRRNSGQRTGGAGGGISSFFRGGSRGLSGNSSNSSSVNKSESVDRRTRFLSEDNGASTRKSYHYKRHHDHHQRQQQEVGFHATAPAASSPPSLPDDADLPHRASLSRWQRWRWGRRTSSFDGALPRQASDNSWRSSGSYGRGGGGGGGGLGFDTNGDVGGAGTGTPGKIPEMLRAAFFDPDYDTSRHHLVKLFNALDTNSSGTITYEAMRMGLANLGTYSDVNYLMRRAEMDKTKEISLDDFVAIVQDYAEKMFAAKQEVPVSCFCYDYSPEDVAFRWVKTGNPNPPSPSVSLRGLMSEGPHRKGGVRWLCVTGSDPSLVIHMANRFGIHPLQVEDCLNPRERLKVDAFRAAPVKAPKIRPTVHKVISAATRETATRGKEAAAPAAPAPPPAPPTAGGEAAAAAAALAATSKANETAAANTTSTAKAGDSSGMPSTSARPIAAAAAVAAAATATTTATPPASAETTTPAGEAGATAGAAAAGAGAGASADPTASSEESPASPRAAATTTSATTTTPDVNDPGTEGLPTQRATSEAPLPALGGEPGDVGGHEVGAGVGVGGTDVAAPAPVAEEILHVVLGRISLRNPTVGRPSNFEREQVSIFLIGDHTVLFIEPTPSGVSDQISNRIYYAGSKVRLNNARYMVYSLMDSIVDDVFPIMQHFQAWLVQLQEQLHSEDAGPSLHIVRAIQQISRDMHMITFYLRPMKVVATQLITDLPGNDADLKRHLEDLRDHLLMLEEQALRMSTWSRSLNKDWVNEQQHRMNQVVYILTMVTSAFMPAQFLTGVFGMNFKFMPELNWRYSYASFWVLVALLAFSSYTVYKRHKWL